ncbi:MAG: hypothetical protein ACRYG7_06905 [Janthinobacterium lividum]
MDALRCLLDTPKLCIWYDPVNDWLYNQWLGYHDNVSVMACTQAISACLRTQPCPKILSDHSQLSGNWLAASPLVGQQGLAQLATQGVAYFAWVYSPHYADRLAMEQALSYALAPIANIFDNLADAYEWLQRFPRQRSRVEAGTACASPHAPPPSQADHPALFS